MRIREAHLHCPLGFDERWPMHCFMAAEKIFKATKVIIYTPDDNNEKTEKAFKTLEYFLAEKASLERVAVPKDPKLFPSIIMAISARIEESLKVAKVVACTTGGMRLLSNAMVLALSSLEPDKWSDVYVYLEVEGEPETGTLFPLYQILAPLETLCSKGSVERAIYAILLQRNKPMRKTDIWKALREMGLSYSKTYIFDKIDELEERGALEVKKEGKEHLVSLKLDQFKKR